MKWSKADIKEWMRRMIEAKKMFPHPTKAITFLVNQNRAIV